MKHDECTPAVSWEFCLLNKTYICENYLSKYFTKQTRNQNFVRSYCETKSKQNFVFKKQKTCKFVFCIISRNEKGIGIL